LSQAALRARFRAGALSPNKKPVAFATGKNSLCTTRQTVKRMKKSRAFRELTARLEMRNFAQRNHRDNNGLVGKTKNQQSATF